MARAMPTRFFMPPERSLGIAPQLAQRQPHRAECPGDPLLDARCSSYEQTIVEGVFQVLSGRHRIKQHACLERQHDEPDSGWAGI
jgi:hypothetical protein